MNAEPIDACRRAADDRRSWCERAKALSALAAPGLPALSLADTQAIDRLPAWLTASATERDTLALITGAVLCARRLRRCIDGRLLGAVAQALGADRLAAVTVMAQRVALPAHWSWGDDVVAALTALGAEALLREADASPALRAWLGRLFVPTDVLGHADPAALRRVTQTAQMLWRPDDGPLRRAA